MFNPNLFVMPIISLSLLSMIKGAIFLSKTTAIKALAVKHGAYIVGKLGIDGTIAVAATASTVTGTAIAIASIPQNTKVGFNKIIDGVANRSAADFFDGLCKVSSAYSTVTGFLGDFNNYVDSFDTTTETKIEIKNTVKEMRSLLVSEIEKKSVELLKEFEEALKQKQLTKDQYLSEIDNIYRKHTENLLDDYDLILGRGGRIYADICSINKKYCLTDTSIYDHYLVYCIAGWILEHVRNLDCLVGISQRKLAHDITDNILYYLKTIGRG